MKNESANLDLLRTIAVALVVVSHLPPFVHKTAPFNFMTLGHFGVALFFVHTTLVLLQSLERTGGAAGPFFVRRFFRIYPLSIFVVIVTTALFSLGGKEQSFAAVVSNLLLVQNLTGHTSTPSPLWTLPFEVQMYLALPALYAVTKTRRPVLKVCALWLAGAALGFMPLLQFVPCFLGGALAFTMRGRRSLSPAVLFAMICALAVVLPLLTANGAPETQLFWLACLALGALLPHCRDIGGGLLSRGAHTVAVYSYGIYLTHIYALGFAFPTEELGAVNWLIFAIALPALSAFAYHAIERPGIDLGRRLSERLETKKRPRPVRAEGVN